MSALPGPGDLAWVVRGHCADQERLVLGCLWTVMAPLGIRNVTCDDCLQVISNLEIVVVTDGRGSVGPYPRAWLRKHEPPADERDVETPRELEENL